MRNGIVAGEPGIFPWPHGRFLKLFSRHRQPEPAETPAPAPGSPAPEAPPEQASAPPENPGDLTAPR